MEKQEIKAKINKILAELSAQIETLKEATKPIAPENSLGRISRMDAINNKAVNDATLTSSKARKARLENTLSGIEADDFGICVKCRKEIPVQRLLYLPETRLCVNCAQK
jgi:DnaK suppressor protein